MMLMMMQNPNADVNSMLPFMLMGDGEMDFMSMFLMTTTMQNNCGDTNDQMNMLLPMLRMDGDESSSNNMKTMLLMQTMSQGMSRDSNMDTRFF